MNTINQLRSSNLPIPLIKPLQIKIFLQQRISDGGNSQCPPSKSAFSRVSAAPFLTLDNSLHVNISKSVFTGTAKKIQKENDK
jgi:hypothetical protein